MINNTKLIEAKSFKEAAKKIESLELGNDIFIKDIKKVDDPDNACYLVIFGHDISSSLYGVQNVLATINESMYAIR